ncbi:hypothetical protein Afil01_17700 [Actinorhabdospora filicis]|uniref:LPXTG-motif cell wall-anchored protein n=1 Tax=Actinorhabdospora filicis TaxID=1785913 RepID=A0A9W6SJ61_9ACTN|nr:LPXTG cell wall anchor domain-containing protein [Actinorhabdospora filicis]GLZ76963.1 hypothetical protein Afil01_17700 [Actinorhabdospora filicis]
MLRRSLAVAAVTGAITTAFLAAPAQAAEPVPAAKAAASWLSTQQPAIPSFGLDHALALVSADVASDKAKALVGAFDSKTALEAYVKDAKTGAYKPGALGKVMLAVEAVGGDVHAFGGTDLEQTLRGLIAQDGKLTGAGTPNDQGLAVLALGKTTGGAPAATVTALATGQCPDGGFGWDWGGANCFSDIDATTLVATALVAQKSPAATKSLDYVEKAQKADGGFADSYSNVENANTTGMAGQLLRSAGRTASADKAAKFLLTLQVGCSAKESERGAIGWNEPAVDDMTAMATAQGVLGLTGEGLIELNAKDDTTAVVGLDCSTKPTPTTPTTKPTNVAKDPLAKTGTSLGVAIAAGAALVGAGAVLVLVNRKRARR